MNHYSFNTKENMAKAKGININVSPKQAIEICNYIRGRPLSQAKRLLDQSINMSMPIPIKRFSNGVGHKRGMGAGRFYPKACSEILKIINSAESNAKNKGLSVADLKLEYITTQTAPKAWHYGRKKRSVFKAAHIEVGLLEVKGLSSKIKRKENKTSPTTAKHHDQKIQDKKVQEHKVDDKPEEKKSAEKKSGEKSKEEHN